MPKVKFTGPWAEADVDGVGHVVRGETYDVPAAVADTLPERSFRKVNPPARKKAAAKAAAPAPKAEEN